MSAVDDRVVAMQFDNAQFEQKLQTTLNGLDQLNKHLDFTNAQKNLGDLSDAGNKFNMGHMGDAVEGVSAKFLAFATVGITAISNLTNRAVNAGMQFAKSFTLAPLQAGFGEFETTVKSTQTILANTARFGTQLPEVQANLGALNTYADKTIYDFGQMTSNLGLFTNAGIKVGDATSMIKGFSNAAAASGTTAEGAAGAAYQLSQALSAGQVRLMDWRSLTNAGMGNKNMQDSLVEIADKMGTLGKAGIKGADVQKDFNGSLEKGWLSADVMSTYLKIMAGDMDAAKLKSMGFTAAQIKGFQDQQKMAEDAATKVRTATQLVGTVKEAIGSGWSETFRIVLGNFDEATQLFTDLNNGIGGFVQKASDARNNLLQGWKDLGGREMLIQGFRDAIAAVGAVMKPVKEAFRDFFPKKTSKDLFDITEKFTRFVQALYPSQSALMKIREIANGFFGVMEIGKTVLKGVIGIFTTIFGQLHKLGAGGGIVDLVVKLANGLFVLDKILVGQHKIADFFNKIYAGIIHVFDALSDASGSIKAFLYTLKTGFTEDEGTPIEELALKIRHFFGIFRKGEKDVDSSLGRIHSRFDLLKSAFEHLSTVGQNITKVLTTIFGYISQWFSELGHNIAAALKPGDFDAALDVLNIGLLGGLVLLLKKFLKGGLNLDVGGGIFGQIKDTLEGVTGQLKAMQSELKAKALMEIAIALGVLTASIVVLSLIDSGKLTKAMAALAIGMGELVAVMKLLDSLASGTKDAAKFGILATGMTLLATAALILSGAVALLAQLSWEQLAKGLGAVTAIFAVMIGTADLMEGSAVSMVAAGLAMIPLATGLVIMAGAVALFSAMSWGSLIKGLVGLSAALGIIAGIMMVMPVVSLLAAGLAMIPLATGLAILAGVILIFGKMSWETMAKGFISLALALGLIAAAMNLMPITTPIIAYGLLKLAEALVIIGAVIIGLGLMKLSTLAKGIGAIAVVLTVLTAAMHLMQGALAGAITMVIVAGALSVLAGVIETLGKMSIKELVLGIGAIVVVIAALGIAAAAMQPIIPAMLALGFALGVIGGAFALFGVGAFLVAKAFEAMASAGVAGMKAIVDSIILFVKAIPMFVSALIASLSESVQELLKAGALLLKLATVFLLQLLDTVIKLAPKIAQAIAAIIDAAIVLLWTKAPMLIATGIMLLLTLLGGIDSRIGDITNKAIDIVVKFAQAMTDNAKKLVDAAVDLLLAFITAVGDRAGDISGAGLGLLLALIKGIADNIIKVVDTAANIISSFVTGLAKAYGTIITAGADAIIKFVEGIAGNITRVVEKATDVAIAFVNAIGDNAIKFAKAAADALVSFLNGLADAIREKTPEIQAAGANIAGAIIDGMTGGLASKAGDVANSAVGVAKGAVGGVLHFIESKSPSKLFFRIGGFMAKGMAQGLDNDVTAENSAVAHAERIVRAFSDTLTKIPDSLEGLDASLTITPVLDLTKVKMGAKDIGQMMSGQKITPEVSIDQARRISTTTELTSPDTPVAASSSTEINFNQYINSPKALSTSDIYKGTKSLIAKVKEEIDI